MLKRLRYELPPPGPREHTHGGAWVRTHDTSGNRERLISAMLADIRVPKELPLDTVIKLRAALAGFVAGLSSVDAVMMMAGYRLVPELDAWALLP